MLCPCILLFGADYRIALVGLEDEASDFLPFLQRLCFDVLFSENRLTVYDKTYQQSQALKTAQQNLWDSVAKAYAKEDDTVDDAYYYGKLDLSFPDRMVKLETPTLDGEARAIFRKGACKWYCDAYGYDQLILYDREVIGEHVRITIDTYLRSSDKTTRMFDKLSFGQDYHDIQADLLLALFSQMTDSYVGIIEFVNTPPSLSVTIDGQKARIHDNYAELPMGSHTIAFSSYGYEDKTVNTNIIAGTSQVLDASLKETVLPSLTLASGKGRVQWFADGLPIGQSSVWKLENVQLPILLEAKKDGFLPQIQQLSKPTRFLYFDMKPSWWNDSALFTSKQKAFYTSFIALVCSVGVTLMIPTLQSIYGGGSVLPDSLFVATEGISAMMAVLLVRNTITYAGSILSF